VGRGREGGGVTTREMAPTRRAQRSEPKNAERTNWSKRSLQQKKKEFKSRECSINMSLS
jgi:hypothetical protein